MNSLRRQSIGRAAAGEALDLLAEWTPGDRFTSALHPGDVGWFLRFDEQECADAIEVWRFDGMPVAVSLMDDPVLRLAQPVEAQRNSRIAEAMADEITGSRGDETTAWCDPPIGSALRAELTRAGWRLDDDPWPHLIFQGSPPDEWPRGALLVTEGDAEDRVMVQRQAFDRSTFTVQRWRQMHDSAAADRAVDVLVRTPDGEPAAAATGWLAGPGRCALLEPVGSRPDLRGQGYGRAAVVAATMALMRRGANAVGVLTPSNNAAALSLYRSAGFRPVAEQHSMMFDVSDGEIPSGPAGQAGE